MIGPKVPDPEKYGTEYNSDYSFDVRSTEAKETVTFKNMTLQSGRVDYLGFSGLKGFCAKETLRLMECSTTDEEKEEYKKAFCLLLEHFDTK